MNALLQTARWEWFKLRHRPLPWALLVLLVAVSQAVIWGAFVAATDLRRGAASAAPPAIAALLELGDAFTLPGSVSTAMLPVRQVVLLFLAVLVAAVVGGDYALGTYRPLVAGGSPRWALLSGKLVMVAGVALAAFVVLTAATAASSIAAAALSGFPEAPPATWDRWVEAGRILAATWAGLLPFAALIALLAVLTRSTAATITIVVAYIFLEPFLVVFLGILGEPLAQAAPYLPLRLLAVWNGPPAFPLAPGPEVEGRSQAAAGLAIYGVVFAAAALWLFQRRDLTSGAAG